MPSSKIANQKQKIKLEIVAGKSDGSQQQESTSLPLSPPSSPHPWRRPEMDTSGRIRLLCGMELQIQRVHGGGQWFPVVLCKGERESQERRRKREEGQMR